MTIDGAREAEGQTQKSWKYAFVCSYNRRIRGLALQTGQERDPILPIQKKAAGLSFVLIYDVFWYIVYTRKQKEGSMNDISGKIAIVTGAGRGIGYALVQALLHEGAKVFATSRNISALKDIGNKNLYAFSADLTQMNSFEKIVSRCADEFGGIDIVINNAAYVKKALLEDTTIEEWDLHMAVNVRAPFMLVNTAMPFLLQSNGATVINIGSVVSKKGYTTQGAYSASKHALLGYTKVLAREVFDRGIRVHTILPGGVATEMVKEARPDLDVSDLSTPEEISDIIVFLLKNRTNSVIDEVSVRRYTKEPWV
jgi:3-oxoacyl-[acyl-carrier protein] reductase